MSEMLDRIAKRLDEALQQIIREEEKGLLLKWTAVVTTSDDDGKAGTWLLSTEGIHTEDLFGLLTYSLEFNKAVLHKRIMEDDNE